MTAAQNWEKITAAIEGYIVPPGEGPVSPTGPLNRAKAWSASTGGLIAVEEVVLRPGSPGPRRHFHTNQCELFYVLEGSLRLQIGEQVVMAGPGTFAFCPIGCVHAFRVAGESAVRLLIMALPPGPAEGYFVELARLSTPGEADWERLGNKWGVVAVGPPLEA
jgi:quercetin dioxygenase-like cupin family protein